MVGHAISVLIIGLMSVGAAEGAVRYRTEISRVEDQTLQQALEASSNLRALQDQKDAPGAAGLVRRAMRDRERMWTALRSFGFYAGDVRVTMAGLALELKDLIPRLQEMAGGEPVVVAIVIETGPLFTIGRFDLLDAATGGADLRVRIDRSVLRISRGDPARAESVIRAETALVEQMRSQGHPFAAVPERQVIVDHATLEMEVTLMVEPGPRAVFGTVTIEGLDEMDEGFVQSRLDPGPDIAYSPEEIRGMRDRLADLEVFSRIGVETADTLDIDGHVPVFVEVTERPRRLVGFRADFNTSEGFGASAYWGHRNLFGRAESLRLQVEVGRIGRNAPGDIDYGLGARYQAPDFLARDQVLFAELSAGRETPEAYRGRRSRRSSASTAR